MSMPETDVAELIRNVNATNNAVEDQCLRAREAADAAIRSDRAAEEAKAAAEAAGIAHQTIQAERPRRRSPLPRQVALAAGTVALDGVACYFAAQALDASQDSTLVWTVLFLAVLAGGEVALDFYRDRNLRAWRILAFTTSAFVACSASSGSGSSPPSEPTAWCRPSPGRPCSPRRRPGSLPWATGLCGPPRHRRRGGPAGPRMPLTRPPGRHGPRPNGMPRSATGSSTPT